MSATMTDGRTRSSAAKASPAAAEGGDGRAGILQRLDEQLAAVRVILDEHDATGPPG